MSIIGVGVDAVDIPRMAAVLDRRPGVARRAFTADERAYAARHRDPAPRLAARFAAKEAVMKALGVGLGDVRMRDIGVERGSDGRPSIELRGGAAQLAAARDVRRLHVSLTHSDTVAVAMVVAESDRA